MLDLATRAHDHSYRIDPIVRSLLDTVFYTFLMLSASDCTAGRCPSPSR
jgi:hypothetical protein